jgi:hypothetical protein
MERSKKKVAVLNKGIRLTEEIAPRDLEDVTGGRRPPAETPGVGCGGPDQCLAVHQF